MTTITYRKGVMCSDSQETRGDFIDNKTTTKVYEVGGCLVGISGNAISARKFVEWFQDMAEHSSAQEAFPLVAVQLPEKMVAEDFHALVACPDDTVYEFFGCDNIMECAEEYAAVGSGMLYALCAMDAGASAEEAVKVAIKRDVYSGGEIQTYKLEEVEELTEEDIRAMSRDALLKLVLGEEEDSQDITTLESGESSPNGGSLEVVFDGCAVTISGEYHEIETAKLPELRYIGNELGIKFNHNIGEVKLRNRIWDFLMED